MLNILMNFYNSLMIVDKYFAIYFVSHIFLFQPINILLHRLLTPEVENEVKQALHATTVINFAFVL